MIYGEKIRQARELRRLTQEELAERIRVHSSAIGLMEIGLLGVNDQTGREIAFATGFPLAFFRDPTNADFPIGSLQFRARKSNTTRRDRAEAHRYGQTLFQVYQKLRARLRMPDLRLPRLETNDVEEAARVTRSALGLSPDLPIKHLTNSVEQSGVVVLALPMRLEGRDAFSLWTDGLPMIAISSGPPGDRVRFSVAHELGHLILHQAPRGSVAEFEKAADRFAAALLLPEDTLREQFAAGVSFTLLASFKPKWGVSIQTLARRARDLGAISERQYYAVFEQMARLGFSRTQEPPNLAIPIERPRALRQMAERVYGIPINYRRMAADVNLTPQLLEGVMAVHAEGSKPQVRTARSVLQLRRGGKS
jgi:Zn-dependent peptidase ImmA (M78 family)/DNA-binding XRE family transcriptional regulator